MNDMELAMVEVLKQGKEKYGFVGVKAEFEAEGTRMDELIKLLDIGRKAGVKIALKIGGCEAVSDLLTAKQIGVDYIIAPMVESSYALSKYIEAKNKVYGAASKHNPKFLFNLETINGFKNLKEMVAQALVENGADGIVFGRGDYTQSRGMKRTEVDHDAITADCIEVAKACRENNLELVVGGGVSTASATALGKINDVFLTRFETRKVIFSSDALNASDIEQRLEQALKFELLWLKNKQEHYSTIAQEDSKRIKILEERLN